MHEFLKDILRNVSCKGCEYEKTHAGDTCGAHNDRSFCAVKRIPGTGLVPRIDIVQECINLLQGISKDIIEPCEVSVSNKTLFDVKTPISCTGEISFNGGKQILCALHGNYSVRCYTKGVTDYRDKFAWERCEWIDIPVGCAAYRTQHVSPAFNNSVLACKKINANQYAYVNEKEGIEKSSEVFAYWFKLVAR